MTAVPLAEQIAALRIIIQDYIGVRPGSHEAKKVDALRAALATLEAAEWRPIGKKNTPREPVELYFPLLPEDRYGHGEQAAMTLIDRVSAYPFRKPTHWRPLPAPPENSA